MAWNCHYEVAIWCPQKMGRSPKSIVKSYETEANGTVIKNAVSNHKELEMP